MITFLSSKGNNRYVKTSASNQSRNLKASGKSQSCITIITIFHIVLYYLPIKHFEVINVFISITSAYCHIFVFSPSWKFWGKYKQRIIWSSSQISIFLFVCLFFFDREMEFVVIAKEQIWSLTYLVTNFHCPCHPHLLLKQNSLAYLYLSLGTLIFLL